MRRLVPTVAEPLHGGGKPDVGEARRLRQGAIEGDRGRALRQSADAVGEPSLQIAAWGGQGAAARRSESSRTDDPAYLDLERPGAGGDVRGHAGRHGMRDQAAD